MNPARQIWRSAVVHNYSRGPLFWTLLYLRLVLRAQALVSRVAVAMSGKCRYDYNTFEYHVNAFSMMTRSSVTSDRPESTMTAAA
ncbi:hypothetical protein EDB89DRAFT_972353 [Lactarius sanguifluus]|nr:hypothetical protein EDB89DRAFT_972353 [Lactarius sanguifluus]